MHSPMPDRIGAMEFAAIDFESAGAVRGATDVPVQVGVAILRPDGSIPREDFLSSYLASDRPVHWTARKVHGISDEDLVDAPTLLETWPEVRRRLGGRWVVAHGAGTEKRFLRAFPGHGFGPWVDTLQIFRRVLPDAESHSLSHLCRVCNLEHECLDLVPNFRWHDALSDAVACLVLLRYWVQTAGLSDASPAVLLTKSQ